MCYKPISIYNNSVFYRSDMPKKILVPCGRCADCQRNQRNEWYLRALYEYKDIKYSGGMMVFPTLTYDNEHLPVFRKRLHYDCYGVVKDRDVAIPCFSAEHIRIFIKKLRVYLKREGYDPNGLRYIVCPEYGSNTKRPHYHCAIGLKYRIPMHTLKRLIKKAWIHGFIGVSKKGFEITDYSGIRYIAKYVTKDLGYYQNFKLNDYLHEKGISKEEQQERKKEMRPYMPYHRQSTFFGYSIAKEIKRKHSTDLLDYLCTNDFEVLNSGTAIKRNEHFPIPRYIVNKLTKYTDKLTRPSKPLLARTQLGVDLAKMAFQKNVLSDKELFYNLSDSAFIDSQVPKHPRRLNGQNDIDYVFEDLAYGVEIRDMKNEFSKLRLMNPEKMSLYYRFLRNLPYKPEYEGIDMFDNVYDIKDNQIQPSTIPVENLKTFKRQSILKSKNIATPLKEFPELKEEITFSSIPEYKEYENICQLIDKYNRLVSSNKKQNYEKKLADDERTRAYFVQYNTL